MLPLGLSIVLFSGRLLDIKGFFHPLCRLSVWYIEILCDKVNPIPMLTAAETLPAVGIHLQAGVFVPGMEKAPHLVLPVQLQPQAAGYCAAIFPL